MIDLKAPVIHKDVIEDLTYSFDPSALNLVDKKVISEIRNAWRDHYYKDDKHQPYLEKEALSRVWRTDKANANLRFSLFADKNKLYVNDKVYLNIPSVINGIFESMLTSLDLNREACLEFSKSICESIVLDPEEVVARTRYLNFVNNKLPRLKLERAKYLAKNANINVTDLNPLDELTGNKLNYNTAEFSHIRCKATYFDLALYYENGLLVNKSTHDLITKEGVSNEIDLTTLCLKMGWDLGWRDIYKRFLKKNGCSENPL